MTGTDAVLESIDGALRDYQTSGDAMRWSPDPQAAEQKEPDAVWFEFARLVDVDALNEFGRRLTAAFSEMTSTLGELCVPLVKLASDLAHAEMARDRKHRIRCATCNPAGNPPPFPGGHEYHRRRKARARRRRRG